MSSLHGVCSAMVGGCLVSTLVSINCPFTEIILELFTLRYAIKLLWTDVVNSNWVIHNLKWWWVHRTYLGFDGPYVFFKLMPPLVKLWRSKGLKAVMYLDNGICAVKGKIEAKMASAWVRDALECAGLVVVPEAKLAVLRAMLQISGVATHLNTRFIASLVGKIISMGLALGPMSRIMTRSLYVLLWSRHAWREHLEINRGVQRELELCRSSSCVAQYNA